MATVVVVAVLVTVWVEVSVVVVGEVVVLVTVVVVAHGVLCGALMKSPGLRAIGPPYCANFP